MDSEARPAPDREHEGEPTHGTPLDLLIVGTFGGGGIHQYIDEQVGRFSPAVSVSVYEMATRLTDGGPVDFLSAMVHSLRAAAGFPFRERPDAVHVHTSHRFSFYRAAFYVLVAAYVWQRPVVLHVHGSSFDEFVRTDDVGVRWLQSVVFDASDRILVLSDYWKDVLASRVPEEKLRVYPNAVDPDAYDPDYGADPPHLVFVSNLIRRKGVEELVAALDALADRPVRFRASVAGDGPLSEDVEALAARHDAVEALGYVSEREKRDLLNGGSVFVLPTYAEGLPIAMLEGMAGGNAVVSTSVGSIPEVIDEGGGVLVEPGRADLLADALQRLVETPDETERMGRRNRALIEEEHAWDRIISRLERLYTHELSAG